MKRKFYVLSEHAVSFCKKSLFLKEKKQNAQTSGENYPLYADV